MPRRTTSTPAMIFVRTGKMSNLKVNYCGKAAQERMIRNGWWLEIPKLVKDPGAQYKRTETEEELYERLSKIYGDVRIYWCGTAIPGIHDHIAMCKNRKENIYAEV